MTCHLARCCQKCLCSTVRLILIFCVCMCQGGQSYWVFRSLLLLPNLWTPIPQIHSFLSVRCGALAKPGMCGWLHRRPQCCSLFLSAFEQDLRFSFTFQRLMFRVLTTASSPTYLECVKSCLQSMSRLNLKNFLQNLEIIKSKINCLIIAETLCSFKMPPLKITLFNTAVAPVLPQGTLTYNHQYV